MKDNRKQIDNFKTEMFSREKELFKPKKLYLLSRWHYEDCEDIGIFSSKEKASEIREKLINHSGYFTLTEFEIDKEGSIQKDHGV